MKLSYTSGKHWGILCYPGAGAPRGSGAGALVDFYLFLNPQHPPTDDAAAREAGHVRQVQLAGEYGFRGVAVGQHLSTEGMQWFPPVPLLSYLAPHCQGLELGTSVLVLPFFNPVLVAEAMAFVDVACGGRSFLGVAAGWNAREFAVLEAPFEQRHRRLREGLEIIRRLWTENEVTYEGQEYHLEGVTLSLKPLRKPRPPIWVGASSERVARRLAGLSDVLTLSSHIPLAKLEAMLAAYRDERERLGLPPSDVPVLRNVFVAESAEAALAEGMPYLQAAYGRFDGWGLFQQVLKTSTASGVLPEVLLERVIIGGPEEVATGLGIVRQRLGANKVLMLMQWYGMPEEKVEQSIRLFGEQVLPRLRGS